MDLFIKMDVETLFKAKQTHTQVKVRIYIKTYLLYVKFVFMKTIYNTIAFVLVVCEYLFVSTNKLLFQSQKKMQRCQKIKKKERRKERNKKTSERKNERKKK